MTLTARNAEDFNDIFHNDFDDAPTPRQRQLHANQLRREELARNHPDERLEEAEDEAE